MQENLDKTYADLRLFLDIINLLILVQSKVVPDQLRIGTNAPNERVPSASLGFRNNSSAWVLRKN